MPTKTWKVSELLQEVNLLLEEGFSSLLVQGEATNVNASSRGHLYFTLKDGKAALDCVMWSSRTARLRFALEDGLAVLAAGELTIYAQRGRFQMVVSSLQPQGQGSLQLAFEQLKAKLGAEGLFADERKRTLPVLPQRVGIVTSATGAALQDMLSVLSRYRFLEVLVADARVQGRGAAQEIARALEHCGASGRVDVIILGRGGGSLEDLWAFNEEVVARAIAACPVPVISGVGHEVDFTIADFVADLRATTPTQAAEIVVTQLEQVERRLLEARQGLARSMTRQLQLARATLGGLEGSSGLARLPQRLALLRARLDRTQRLPSLLSQLVDRCRTRLQIARKVMDQLPHRLAIGGHARVVATRQSQLIQLIRSHLQRSSTCLQGAEQALGHLSPRKILERGYSITTIRGETTPLRDSAAVAPGTWLESTLAKGRLRSLVPVADGQRRRASRPSEQQPNLFSSADDERSSE